MLQAQLFTKTEKQAPKGEESKNAILLQRAGFVAKEMAGVYTFLPLGFLVLKKIEQIIREEMLKLGAFEI
ncbi:MAG: prolyl-tRNA synthetase, partial [bacterium]|nr:prolyl-tRNA synthetase [bacterium]